MSTRHTISLLFQLIRRDIGGRYRGSALGMVWSLLTPLLLLAVYTVVFGMVFKSRWPQSPDASQGSFALILLAGLTLHALLSECLNRAPSLILANSNFVKKVVFPLALLPLMIVITALFHSLISTLVLIIGAILLGQELHVTLLLYPLVLLPFFLFCLSVSYALAALGVYVRDISHVMGLLTMILMFLSPIFYPITSLPSALQPYIYLNPLTLIVQSARKVLLWGEMPNWWALALYALVAGVLCLLSVYLFQKTRKGFADVL